MDEPVRVIDLIPRRQTTFALCLVVGLGVIAGLEALYAWASTPALMEITSDGRIAAFDLDGEGSLAVWFSSASLVLASLIAVLIYAIRRHKSDDYQGYYRIWLWSATCWLVMSIDEASSLHEGFAALMTRATGAPLFRDGSLWWVIPYFFVLGAVGSRLLVDMRLCKLSSAALLAAAACYGTAVVTQVLSDGLTRAVMLEEGAEMVGNLLLMLAMALHARHVILDAEGELPRRQTRPRPLSEEPHEQPSTVDADEWITIDSRHGTPQPVLKRRTRTVEPEPVETPVRRKLTKAEKKALRKRLMQERLHRQRQQHDDWS